MKKKGAALVMMLVIVALLLVLSMTVLYTATSTIKTTMAEDKINRTNLIAQSGIVQGIAVLKNTTPPNVPTEIKYNILDDNGNAYSNNYEAINFSYSSGTYTIISTANYSNYSRSVTQKITVNTQDDNSDGMNLLINLFNYTLGIINQTNTNNYSINFKSQGAAVNVTFNGPLYISGNPNNFTSDNNAGITINGDITTNEQPGINDAALKNDKGTEVNGNIQTINTEIQFPTLINMNMETPITINVNGYTIKLINSNYYMTTADSYGKEIIICSGFVHFNKDSGNIFNGLNIYSSGIYVDDNGNYSINITGNNISDNDKNAIASAVKSYIQ